MPPRDSPTFAYLIVQCVDECSRQASATTLATVLTRLLPQYKRFVCCGFTFLFAFFCLCRADVQVMEMSKWSQRSSGSCCFLVCDRLSLAFGPVKPLQPVYSAAARALEGEANVRLGSIDCEAAGTCFVDVTLSVVAMVPIALCHLHVRFLCQCVCVATDCCCW